MAAATVTDAKALAFFLESDSTTREFSIDREGNTWFMTVQNVGTGAAISAVLISLSDTSIGEDSDNTVQTADLIRIPANGSAALPLGTKQFWHDSTNGTGLNVILDKVPNA